MDVNCLRGFILIQLLVKAKGQNLTDTIEERKLLKLTNEHTVWNSYHTTCLSRAGTHVFCSNSSGPCTPEIAKVYDSSSLPDEYTAWIDSYLFNSFTITVKGCYEIFQKRDIIEKKGRKDIKSCALSCDSRFDFIGWLDGKCYCVLDTVVSVVSTLAKKLPSIDCANQLHIANRTVIYQKFNHYNLMNDLCPVVYYFGGKSTNEAIVKCEEENKFICNNSDKDIPTIYNKTTWQDAVNTCTNMSAKLLHEKQVPDYQLSKFAAYWSYGITIKEFNFDKNKIQNTRCTALKRGKRGRMSFVALNCSTELPTLCLQLPEHTSDPPSTTTHLPTTETQYEETTVLESSVVEKSSIKTSAMTSRSRAEPKTSSDSTTVILDTSTKQQKMHTSKESQQEESGAEPVWIAVGIMVFVIGSIIVIVLYCRSKKKNSGCIQGKKMKQFRDNEASSGRVLEQTHRYLPSVMTYPSGYGISGMNFTSEPVVVSVHNDGSDSKGVENALYNHGEFSGNTDYDLEDDQSRLVSGSYLNVARTSDSKDGFSDKDNNKDLLIQCPDNNSDDDKYVSMKNVPLDNLDFEKTKEGDKDVTENLVQETNDFRRDLSEDSRSTLSTTADNGEELDISPLDSTADKGEESEASPLVSITDNSEENEFSIQSIATETNKDSEVPLLSTTVYNDDNVQVHTLPDSADNNGELEVSILRELIRNENTDLDFQVPMSGDRIDSIVFR